MSDGPSRQSLVFVPTEDLVSELFARFDHVIFAGTQDMGSTKEIDYLTFLHFHKGTKLMCLGMTSALAGYLSDKCNKGEDFNDAKEKEL